jgi:hypothetical protein
MTRTLLPGTTEPASARRLPNEGCVLLRTLTAIFILIICFAVLSESAALLARRAALLAEQTGEELDRRNAAVPELP